jgi:Icc protein
MPELLWASDCHLDHASPDTRAEFRARLASLAGASLVVTGDISTAATLIADLEFLAEGAPRPVYFVLGNHDHYGSSIAAVRDAVLELGIRRPAIQWLPPAGVVLLDKTTAQVGVDGWADGRYGDPLGTPLVLNDDRLIAELAEQPARSGKLAVRRALAQADAARLTTLLERATATAATTIVIATHVPPFLEALPRTGRLAHPHWQPLLVCAATGQAITECAARFPDRHFLVLCGHTHAATDVMVTPNVRCRVMGARYGEPGVDAMSLSS